MRARFDYEAIWRNLAARWSVRLPADVMEQNTPAPMTCLCECAECGLEHFQPMAPGNVSFYRELTLQTAHYPAHRWEFDVVDDLIEEGSDLVDLGCGPGLFLRQVKGKTRRLVGVDHNPDSARDLNAGGIESYSMDFGAFAKVETEAFDVACAFQLIEHLPSVDIFLEPAVRCLRPGGRLFISAPNRGRYGRRRLEALDCPPHHVSRWHYDHFSILAERYGLTLTAVKREPPTYRLAVLHWHDMVRETTERYAGRNAGRLLGLAYGVITMPPPRYRRLCTQGYFAERGVWGHSMVAELRKPSE